MSIPYGTRSLFPQLELVDPGQVQACLGPDHAPLWQVVHGAWADFLRRRAEDPDFHDWEESDVAHWMHTQTRRRAQSIFRDNLRIRPRRLKSGMYILDCQEQVAITIKKLLRPRIGPCAGEMCRSNNLKGNEANKDYWDQRDRDEFPNHSRVILGWLPEQEMTAIKTVIGYPRTRGLELRWHYWLIEPPQMGLWIVPTDPAPDQPAPGFEIVPDADEEGADR
jgi:hypothetical protein